METAHENVEKLRQAYQLWNDTRGASVDHWLGLLDDDVVLRSVADGVDGLDFMTHRKGLGEARDYFTGLAADWEMVHFTPKEFVAQGNRVVMIGECAFRNRRTGKVASSAKADVFTFREGRVVEVMEFFDTARASAATRP